MSPRRSLAIGRPDMGLGRATGLVGSSMLAVMAAIVLSACNGGDWEVRAVTEVGGDLVLDIASCNATYDVAAEEGPTEIRISLEQLTPTDPPGAECADDERVELEKPIGARTVTVNGDRFVLTRFQRN